ncbi:MAG: exosortase/archaeosortase family protein [Candidatus Omnitrophica bacterium]|nr:exosortase/archaeosortase family protein [Candidatus Omnitrophota bacterium]
MRIFLSKFKSSQFDYVIWLLIFLMYAPALKYLYEMRWKNIDYSHAYFIFPVALAMMWCQRATLLETSRRHQPASGDAIGLAAAVIGLGMFTFGWRHDFYMITALSMIPVFWGAVRFLYGHETARAASGSILYLLFLVPPPLGLLDQLTLPMRYGVSAAAEVILKACHYPVLKKGLLISIGGHELFMASPCSGFRSLVTVLALTVAYVTFSGVRGVRKMVLVLSSIPLALLGNLLRVIGLCLVTFYAGLEAAEGPFHELSGIFIFIFVLVCLIGLEKLLDRDTK